MDNRLETPCTAFAGFDRIASGELAQVILKAKEVFDRDEEEQVLIFDDRTSELIYVDLRENAGRILERLRPAATEGASAGSPGEAARGPGRPRLGVVAREVTLLPRHWDWLNSQPGGASVALRKLVEEARRTHAGKDRVRQSQEAAYRFMSAVAGNLPGFEEATRALFAAKAARFDEEVADWPADVRDHARKLAAVALEGTVG